MAISLSKKTCLEMLFKDCDFGMVKKMLPYPLRKVTVYDGSEDEMYDIPEDYETRKKVLDGLCFLNDKAGLDDTRYCLHEDKTFKIGDYKVMRYNGLNILVSPFYEKSGGTILDWVKAPDEPFMCNASLPVNS